MENFRKLTDIILLFKIGITLYKGVNYFVICDSIIDRAYGDEVNKLTSAAVWDLLLIPPDQSLNHVSYLKSLLRELADYGDNTNSESDAFEQFGLICLMRNIQIDGDVFAGVTVTQAFNNELRDEIETRKMLVDKLDSALQRSINHIEPDKISIYINFTQPVVFDINNKHQVASKTTAIAEWDKIKESIMNASTEKSVTGTVIPFYSFEQNILSEAGRKIFSNLKQEYSNSRPKKITSMLNALDALDLLSAKLHTFNKAQTATALSYAFNRTYSPQALNYQAKNNSIKTEERLIKTFLA